MRYALLYFFTFLLGPPVWAQSAFSLDSDALGAPKGAPAAPSPAPTPATPAKPGNRPLLPPSQGGGHTPAPVAPASPAQVKKAHSYPQPNLPCTNDPKEANAMFKAVLNMDGLNRSFTEVAKGEDGFKLFATKKTDDYPTNDKKQIVLYAQVRKDGSTDSYPAVVCQQGPIIEAKLYGGLFAGWQRINVIRKGDDRIRLSGTTEYTKELNHDFEAMR